LKSEFFLALTTCPDTDAATSLAHAIVEKKLAACVNIIPAIQSIYQWQAKIQSDSECLLMMKTNQQHLIALEHFIASEHPYDVPEFITFDIHSGAQSYLDWIQQSLN